MVSFEDFKKLDLRVAKVTEVREHPNADKLYVMQIDTGCETKQIIAGIRAQYSPDDLVGRKIVVINNLEPTTIRGEESNGMLLAANDEGTPIILLPERDVPEGSPIT
jgi:methionyl-tRNA synthetase